MVISKRTVIVGGGIVGLACAHFLRRTGRDVVVIDQGQIGKACSHGNCGLICPSHVLPLAEPGAIGSAIRSVFQPASPFRVHPSLDWRRWYWFWRFARRCNTTDLVHGGRSIQPLLESSMRLYQELVAAGELDCEWEQRGLMYVYRDPRRLRDYEPTNRLLTEQFGEPARLLDEHALRELEPALKPGLAGGWYYEHDAHLRPDKLVATWRQRLAERGVQFRESCDFRRFEAQGRSARCALVDAPELDNGQLTADEFVIATGALTPFLEGELGCRVPIQPGKGYSLTLPRPTNCPRIPLIFPEHRVAVTPMQSGFRLGSMMEFAGYDASLPAARLELLVRGAVPYLDIPAREPGWEEWTGWRPMTWDSLPIIDRAPRFQNVWIAAGHNMLGVTMAPATGQLIAELVAGQTPHIDPRPYRHDRF